jgi:hypothetical protein
MYGVSCACVAAEKMPPRNPGRHEAFNTNPQRGWQPLDRGGAAVAAEPLVRREKEPEPAERVAENAAFSNNHWDTKSCQDSA